MADGAGRGAGAVEVVLDAAEAFGSGSHPTTRLCLAQVERLVRPGDRVLDVGCGTGVLGVAALLLGAGRLTAVDIDPAAVRATAGTARLNGVGDRTQASTTPLEQVRDRFDLVLANLLIPAIELLGADLARVVAPGGHLVVSGVLAGQVDRVGAALGAAPASVTGEDGWAAVGVRPGLSGCVPGRSRACEPAVNRPSPPFRPAPGDHTVPSVGNWFDEYDLGGFFDEIVGGDGRVRPHYDQLASALDGLGPEDLARAERRRTAAFRTQGITFTVYGDDEDGAGGVSDSSAAGAGGSSSGGIERTFPMDLLPRVIPSEEWEHLERGLVQRVRALNRFLDDLYVGGMQIVARRGGAALARAVVGRLHPGGVRRAGAPGRPLPGGRHRRHPGRRGHLPGAGGQPPLPQWHLLRGGEPRRAHPGPAPVVRG